ncbi:MFS transporter [Oceanicola sp. S124]|uniref:MFS transporter n=1 Tax=Oceanicola sp. S124 TaxID=1042378 RepID=UPI00025593EF|nr:MFS transporter [Oceanicola sp. S124]
MPQDPTTFRRFLLAAGLTNLGDGIATLAWTWLASTLTRDPVLIALMPVALRLPWFLFAIPAGLVTDRVQRKRLLLAMDVIRGLAFGLAATCIWQALPLADPPAAGASDPMLFSALALTALVIGIAEVFRDTAAQTVLPSIVDHARLEVANARFSTVELIGNTLLGPALGAFLIGLALPLPFAVNAAAYLLAAVILLRLTIPRRGALPLRRPWRHELAEGFRFLAAEPTLRLLAVFTGGFNLLHQMIVVGLVLHAQENLQLSAEAFGLVLSAGAFGGILAGFIAGPLVARFAGARVAQVSSLTCGFAFGLLLFVGGGIGLSACLMLFSFCGLLWDTVSVSFRQRAVPDALLGRVNSLYRLCSWGMMPVGLALSGLSVDLAERLVPRETALLAPFAIASLGVFLLTALGWRGIGRGFSRLPG